MSQEPEKAAQDPAKAQPGTEKRHKRPSVMLYLVILFAAAFLLMAWSYVIQQRANHETMSDLEESSSALENVIQENEDLKAQAAELERQLADAQDQLDTLSDTISDQEQVLEQTCQAMDYFWQVNEAYVRGRYTLCRELITAMEDTSNGQTPLKDYLPTESTTNNDRFSPADRYQEIYDDLY